MNKRTGIIVLGIMLLAIVVYIFSGGFKEEPIAVNPTMKETTNKIQASEIEKKIDESSNNFDDLRSALQGVVQDSIEKDIQEAVQSEVAKTQK